MTNKVFTIAGNEIAPGTRTTILFPAPNINTQVKIDIPVHVFNGKHKGPTLFITCAIHGDEVNSIEIIRRVHEHIHVNKLCGTLITLPVANIHGLMLQTRYLSDRRDLNRSFPGSKKGTLANRLAHGIMEHIVSHCDYGIDLHTGAAGHLNIPQLRVDFTVPGSREYAKSFNAPVILSAKQRDGSLRQAASQLGIPVLVYEGGEALRYNELCIRAGVRGVLNVMRYLKMLHAYDKTGSQKSRSVISDTSRWVRAPQSGLFEAKENIIGKPVKKGDILAHIHDPFLINPSSKVIAPFNGIIIGQALKAIATEGDALFHLASFKKIAGVKSYIDELREERV